MSRRLAIGFVCLVSIAAIWLGPLFLQPIFFLNMTASEPLGIYLPVAGREFSVGDFVVMDVPSAAKPYVYGRGWLKEGVPLLKRIGALPGSVYEVRHERFVVDGKDVGAVAVVDREGLPLPAVHGVHTVEADCFLPLSTYSERSFDGRYVGQVSQELIRSRVRPLWVWE